jgi:hypothetical protein
MKFGGRREAEHRSGVSWRRAQGLAARPLPVTAALAGAECVPERGGRLGASRKPLPGPEMGGPGRCHRAAPRHSPAIAARSSAPCRAGVDRLGHTRRRLGLTELRASKSNYIQRFE